jgi:hypothetical protein
VTPLALAMYTALSWSMTAFAGIAGACALLRPRPTPRKYWSMVFKMALSGGVLIGVLSLLLGVSFIWVW